MPSFGVSLHPAAVASLRRRIVTMIVEHEADVLRAVSQELAQNAALARSLGLAPELFREVVNLAKTARANEHMEPPIQLSFKSPPELRGHLAAVAKQHGFTPAHLAVFSRSLFHAVMQTSHEPSYRGGNMGGGISRRPHPKGRRVKPLPIEAVAIPYHRDATCDYRRTKINPGLRGAMRARAKNQGKSVSRYCELWLLDAIDQLLPKGLVIEPVQAQDLFPRAENYVLPAKKPLPETLLGDSGTIEGTPT